MLQNPIPGGPHPTQKNNKNNNIDESTPPMGCGTPTPHPDTHTHTHTHTPSARPVRPRFQILGVGGAGVCSSLRHTRVHTAQPRFRGPLPLSTAPALPPRSPCAMLSSPARLLSSPAQASQTLPYSPRGVPKWLQSAQKPSPGEPNASLQSSLRDKSAPSPLKCIKTSIPAAQTLPYSPRCVTKVLQML